MDWLEVVGPSCPNTCRFGTDPMFTFEAATDSTARSPSSIDG
jgi:hypothetical protein